MLFRNQPPKPPFNEWMWKQPENRHLLVLTGVLIVVHFAWFKLLFPYPNFIPDSYQYIRAAMSDTFVDMRPIGYSRFLRIFSCFSNSHFLLVSLQYLFLQAGVLYFLFVIRYLLQPCKWLWRAVVVLNVANPLLSHVSNLVTSDALFTALTFIWFAQVLILQWQPGQRLLAAHALVLLLAFTLRYNALYYPVISIIAILIGSLRFSQKAVGILLVILPVCLFVLLTRYENKKTFGVAQFSAFSGWQLAANGLTAYAQLPADDPARLPAALRTLHAVVNRHMDALRRLPNRPDSTMNIYYMWDKQSPLNRYRASLFATPTAIGPEQQWALMGPLYEQYGRWLIGRHPAAFYRYFIVPNATTYLFPNAEFLALYNIGDDTVRKEVVEWFKWPNNTVNSTAGKKPITLMGWLVFLQFFSTLLFVPACMGFALLKKFTASGRLVKNLFLLTVLVWAANAVFSISSAIVVLRYQIFSQAFSLTFGLLFLAHIILESRRLPR